MDKQSDTLQKNAFELALTNAGQASANNTAKTIFESVKAATIIFLTLRIVLAYPFLQKFLTKIICKGSNNRSC